VQTIRGPNSFTGISPGYWSTLMITSCRYAEQFLEPLTKPRFRACHRKLFEPSKIVRWSLVIGIQMVKQRSEPQHEAVLNRFGFRRA
jgi:hypothetical protein